MYDPMKSLANHLGSARKAFSLIELLVVVCIIAVLAALLMPTMSMARRAAIAAKCGSNQRQLAIAFITYSVDQREFPTLLRPDCRNDVYGNGSDETCGFIDSERIGFRYKYGTGDWMDPDDLPNHAYLAGAFEMVWNLGYLNLDANEQQQNVYNGSRRNYGNGRILQGCQKRNTPPYSGGSEEYGYNNWGPGTGGVAHWGPSWHRSNDYFYFGPNTVRPNVENCGYMSGFSHLTDAYHGYRAHGDNAHSPSQTPMLVCPYVQKSTADGTFVAEPHGVERWTEIGAVSAGGAGMEGQMDRPGYAWATSPYNRNVAYADGHVKHVVCQRGQLADQ